MPEYEKEETSKANKKGNDTKTNTNNVINMLEPIECVYMMSPKFDEQPNYDTDDEKPKVVLRTHNPHQYFKETRSRVSLRVVDSSTSHGETLNAITRGDLRLFLRWLMNPTIPHLPNRYLHLLHLVMTL